MAKRFCFLLSLVLVAANCFSQNDEDTSIRKTAIAVCNCLEINNIDKVTTEEETQQVFFKCLLDSASEKIASIMFGGTVANPETVVEEFGTKLAVELMSSGCKPFVRMSLKLAGGKSSISENNSPVLKTAEGEVIKVEEKDFLYISVKTAAGREISLIYMSYVPESDKWIENPGMLENKKVSVKWTEAEVYQPKLKEFINLREIKELHIDQL